MNIGANNDEFINAQVEYLSCDDVGWAHTPGEAVHENEVAATCTEGGHYDEVVYCAVCSKELSRETKLVDASGHTPADPARENEVAATVETAGHYDEVVYCAVCGEELSREQKTIARVQLAKPTLSSVSNVNGGVQIKWSAVSGAAKYRVLRKTGSGSWTKVGDTTGTSYTDKTASSGTTYSYAVRCLSSSGGFFTSAQSGSKSIRYIAAPVVSVSCVNGGVRISWGKVTGAAKYRVYRKTGSGSWGKIADTTATSFTDKSGKIGTKYSYTVRCISSDGKSFTSAYDTTGKSIVYYKLATPGLPTVTNITGGVKITWSKVTGAVKYRVFRKTGSGGWAKIADTTALTYTDKGVKNGTTYTYTIRCISSDGKSYTSNYNATGTKIAYLTGPALTSAVNTSGLKMTIKWGKNGSATGYQIQYSTSSTFASGNKTVTVTGAGTLSKVIESLTKGTTYYVRVRAYKTVSGTKYYSPWSAKQSVKITK